MPVTRIGTMDAATDRDDESYLDFVEGVRFYTFRRVEQAVRDRANRELAAYADRTGHVAETMDDLHAALDGVPIVATRNRLMRSIQEMMWSSVVDTYAKRREALIAELDAADRRGPGSVSIDPAFPLPDYFTTVDFHLQPGSYHSDPLAGYHYHYATKWLYTGENDNDQLQRGFVGRVQPPDDGQVRRVLDLGCSLGQSTTALKERFPGAEVWGIDAAAPMLRYAHKRAIDLGLDVHYKQALAEQTGFPDGSFDIVFAYILFHEIPAAITRRVVAEAYRLLRPGGTFTVVDFQMISPSSTPLQRYNRDFFEHHNAEPYSGEFITCAFTDILRATGFRTVDEGPSEVHISWMWTAER